MLTCKKEKKTKASDRKMCCLWSYCNLINAKVKIVKLNLVKIIIESYSFYIIYLLIYFKRGAFRKQFYSFFVVVVNFL